ncbi:hypothetical protein SBOR_0933 [Sclerotinia borealis F-4128]|uniref:CCCH zinc finger and RRM domain-containing protein n=1 Tax=Sclerotinia borealis (strain F-4128) TaxID=1432307 RepID=W9CVW0_SCLBF|nr:hypothetical protein SBOR_0933 [Sclerotinia borealis F-4128]
MLFPEEDTGELKKWIIKRLENTSDADADVLADYVLALLRHDGDVDAVRQLCLAEIPDFLKEDTSNFVQDVFNALQYKSYLSAGPPRRLSQTFAPPTGPSGSAFNNLNMGAPMVPQNGSRKRAYDVRAEGDSQMYMGGGDQNARAYKQPRRGNGAGRGNFDNLNNGRGGFQGRPQQMQMPNAPFMPSIPNMPGSPSGLPPLDPNNPMAALLAMQQAMGAMGLPLPQGMPGFSPNGSTQNRGHTGPNAQKKQRCRDYDQKGFCARGNTCLFEHGQDSIYVPGGAAKPTDEYDPSNASLMTGNQNQNDNGQGPAPYKSFDNNRGSMGRGRGQSMGRGGPQMNSGRGGRRAEFSSDRPNFNTNNTTIVVEQIPEEKFSDEAVREFFSQFGSIKEVDMRPYKRLALVKYDDWNAANTAYSSPKVIFDNRFVKVYWYTNPESLPKPPFNGSSNGATNNGAPVSVPARETDEPQFDIEEFTRKQQEVQRAHEEKMKKKQEMEANRKELERRQEELLKNQAEEKRKLMEKLAAKTGKSASPIIKTEDGSPAPAASSQTEALKKQLAALEAEAQSLGLPGLDSPLSDDTWGGRGRGRGGYRGRGTFAPRGFRGGGYRGRGGAPFAGSAPARYTLDNRTKKIAVTGADFTNPQTDESLREHLLGIGEYTELTKTSTGCHITFKDRHTAEKFMFGLQNGEVPSVGKVDLAWIQTPLPPVILPNTQNSAGGGDVKIEGAMEGDAMAQDSTSMGMGGTGGERDMQENIDYDVAGDDDWGVQ